MSEDKRSSGGKALTLIILGIILFGAIAAPTIII
jgi:hypothetical protein